jgi:hypothetical protein
MHPARKPEVIDPDRIKSDDREEMTSDEHRSRANELNEALHASCDYANALWEHLDAVRHYLVESLPSDPRAPGPYPRASAAPTGPDDEAGWERWVATYAAATSILAGPHGDSGFGLNEAKHAAKSRREAPVLKLLAETGIATRSEPLPGTEQPTPPPPGKAASANKAALKPIRSIALGVLSALALRGLLVRRGAPPFGSR